MIIENLLTSKKSRPFEKMEPESITIHWIGPYPSHNPSGVRNWFEKGNDGSGSGSSAHFIVSENEILQCVPVNEKAWHAGDGRNGKGNSSSIGIEVIPDDKEGSFSGRTIARLGELLSVLPKLPLVRHFDWSGKDCPKYYTPKAEDGEAGNGRWERLKETLGILRGDLPSGEEALKSRLENERDA